jgi:nucleotide-binding universal stress UspA family protein
MDMSAPPKPAAGKVADPFSRLLVGIDDSPPSEAAIALASRIAGSRPFSRIRFVDVVDRELLAAESTDVLLSTGIGEVFDAARAAANSRLEKAVAAAQRSGVAAEGAMREGAPVEELLADARSWGATCIVMGTHGRDRVARAVLGSCTEGLLRKSTIPVLVTHGSSECANGNGLSRILCAIDDSVPARAAFEAALAVARERNAQLLLLTIVAIDDMYAEAYEHEGFDPAGSVGGLYEEARTRLLEFARSAKAQNVRAETCVTGASEVGPAIVAYAADSGSDLIVLGAHGLHGIERAFLGSTAENVLRHSTKPVLALHVP